VSPVRHRDSTAQTAVTFQQMKWLTIAALVRFILGIPAVLNFGCNVKIAK